MKRNIVIATVAAVTLIGGGTAAAYAAGDDGAIKVRSDGGGAAKAVGAKPVGAEVTAADAIAAALRHTPGTAVAADRDDDGPGAWEVDVVKGGGAEYTVQVSPDTGRILGTHRDNDDNEADNDGREDLAALKGTGVDAREAAQAVASKGTVTDIDLDDDGQVAWSVETPKGEWTVDAHTGRVTQDRDDD